MLAPSRAWLCSLFSTPKDVRGEPARDAACQSERHKGRRRDRAGLIRFFTFRRKPEAAWTPCLDVCTLSHEQEEQASGGATGSSFLPGSSERIALCRLKMA